MVSRLLPLYYKECCMYFTNSRNSNLFHLAEAALQSRYVIWRDFFTDYTGEICFTDPLRIICRKETILNNYFAYFSPFNF